MSLRSDHKALAFVGAVAILGTGVRAFRASARAAPASQPALETQARAADSAARAQPDRASRGGGGGGQQGRSARPKRRGRASRRGQSPAADSSGASAASKLPMDRVGYVNGRLDLDVATAAQIDSLAGVTPMMAKRIVLDRMHRGPFLNLDGLKRVGPRFIQQIDSLVTFSGTVRWAEPMDTVIPKRGRKPRPPS